MRALSAILVCAALAAAPRVARADSVEQAKALFSAGAAAYDKHDYVGAIRAFEGAQQLAPRPAIVFSLAQAHRRQFYVDGNAAHQKTAIDLFRDYVKEVPSGGRHEDAMRALQELGALSPQQDVASVSINASGTPGARVALDGAAPVEAPLIGPVSPGKHHAVVSADGFVTEARDITAISGQIVALDVPLKEKLARVEIVAPSGAAVDVDGRPSGETPLAAPLELGAGPHLIAITKNGHDAYASELELGRGEQRRISAPLPASRQRTIAIDLLLASGALAVGGGVSAALAAVYLGQANDVLALKNSQNIGAPDVARYNQAVDFRAAFLVATAASFGTAAVLAATGLVLYVFDKPTVSAVKSEKAKPTERKPVPADLAVSPLLSPSTVGVSALLRF
jgi:hypothetical protein